MRLTYSLPRQLNSQLTPAVVALRLVMGLGVFVWGACALAQTAPQASQPAVSNRYEKWVQYPPKPVNPLPLETIDKKINWVRFQQTPDPATPSYESPQTATNAVLSPRPVEAKVLEATQTKATSASTATTTAIAPPPSAPELLLVKGFQFTGNGLFSESDLAMVLQPVVGVALNMKSLEQIVALLNHHYNSLGQLGRAEIPPQEMISGVIQVAVREGRLERAVIEPEAPLSPATAMTKGLMEISPPNVAAVGLATLNSTHVPLGHERNNFRHEKTSGLVKDRKINSLSASFLDLRSDGFIGGNESARLLQNSDGQIDPNAQAIQSAGAVLIQTAGGNVPPALSQADLLVSSVGVEVSKLIDQLAGGESDPSRRAPLAPIRQQISAVIASRPSTMSVLEQTFLAKGQRDEIFGALLPQVGVSAGTGVRQYDLGSGESRTQVDGESQQKSMTVSQLLWDFGGTKRTYEASGKRLNGLQFQMQMQTSEVVLNSLVAIHEVERGFLLQELAQANLSSNIALVQLIRQREALGASSKADVIRAEAKIPVSKDEQASAQRKLASAQATYREIFGRNATRKGLPIEIASNAVISDNFDASLTKHPLVMQAVLARDAAVDDIAAMRGRNFGSLSLNLSVGNRRDLAIDNTPRQDNSLFLNFNSTLYTGGAASAREDQAASRYRIAEIELDKVRQETERKLRQAFSEYLGQANSVDARLQSVRTAEQAFAVTKELYVSKRGNLLDVFNAQQELSVATRGLIDSLVDRAVAKYSLMHVSDLLRGWIEKSL
jgi:adhesin transport system outer membrane protein